MNIRKIALSMLLGLAGISAQAQTTWKSDPMHTQLKFDISHMGINTVSGSFSDFKVNIVTNQSDFSDAKIDMTAQIASISTGIPARDNHLKSEDFFFNDQFPTLTFQTTNLEKAGKNQYKLTGNLTMHGITKPVTMNLTFRGKVANPRDKKQDVAGFHLSGELKRSDFKIGGQFAEPMLGETVTIIADGEFNHS